MIDIFSVFSKANALYYKLQQDNQDVNISLPCLTNGTHCFNVEINYSKTEPKMISLENDYKTFSQFPKVFRGTVASIEQSIKHFLLSIASLKISLYKEFSSALESILYPQGIFIGKTFQSVLHNVSQNYFSDELATTYQMNFFSEYPAKIVVFSVEKACSLMYDFTTSVVTVSGFKDKGRVNLEQVKNGFPYEINEIKVEETMITERSKVGHFRIFRQNLHVINENLNAPTETSNEVLDKVIQSLILTDMLDALQDAVIDEVESGVLLFFDPILTETEINSILVSIKQKYPGSQITNEPSDDSPWWVVEVYYSQKTKEQIQQTYQVSDDIPVVKKGGSLLVPAKTTLDDLVKDIDTDALLTNIGKK